MPASGGAMAGAAAPGRVDQHRSLISPSADFLCLGGLTFAVVPLLLALPDAAFPYVAAISFGLAHFVNHPHFAHSYQIFYRGFAGKLADPAIPRGFRARYAFAGLVVPAGLAFFLLGHLVAGDARSLGLAGNLMAFLVGWHYVKQGYGMAIVQSVLKRRFFGDLEKKVMLCNAYACWVFAWLLVTRELGERSLWGIEYLLIDVRPEWLWLTGSVAAVATAGFLAMLARRLVAAKPIAWSGLTAYLVTLYVWLFAALDPMLLLIVPALHSLQYLNVVWRYELNYQRSRAPVGGLGAAAFGDTPGKRLARFVALGIAFGYFGFWALPDWLGAYVPYDRAALGPGALLFVCWIFINVHHYFIDNVLWRRENPDTGRYLFAAR
jgi:hypothetical protein